MLSFVQNKPLTLAFVAVAALSVSDAVAQGRGRGPSVGRAVGSVGRSAPSAMRGGISSRPIGSPMTGSGITSRPIGAPIPRSPSVGSNYRSPSSGYRGSSRSYGPSGSPRSSSIYRSPSVYRSPGTIYSSRSARGGLSITIGSGLGGVGLSSSRYGFGAYPYGYPTSSYRYGYGPSASSLYYSAPSYYRYGFAQPRSSVSIYGGSISVPVPSYSSRGYADTRSYELPPSYRVPTDAYATGYAPRDLPAVAEEYAGPASSQRIPEVGNVVQGDPQDPTTKLAPGMVLPDGSRIISVSPLDSSPANPPAAAVSEDESGTSVLQPGSKTERRAPLRKAPEELLPPMPELPADEARNGAGARDEV